MLMRSTLAENVFTDCVYRFISAIQDPQLKDAVADLGGSLLLLERARIKLAIPVMVFSFNHSPIISAFAVDQKRQYGAHADERS